LRAMHCWHIHQRNCLPQIFWLSWSKWVCLYSQNLFPIYYIFSGAYMRHFCVTWPACLHIQLPSGYFNNLPSFLLSSLVICWLSISHFLCHVFVILPRHLLSYLLCHVLQTYTFLLTTSAHIYTSYLP
jgi:hypothetical protein